jgi:hypothetical protein
VVWAWQQIHTSRGSTPEARDYLLRACERGLPVYSEGLRLLLDGLLLLGRAGIEAHRRMMGLAVNVMWTSPLVTRLESEPGTSGAKAASLEVSFTD